MQRGTEESRRRAIEGYRCYGGGGALKGSKSQLTALRGLCLCERVDVYVCVCLVCAFALRVFLCECLSFSVCERDMSFHSSLTSSVSQNSSCPSPCLQLSPSLPSHPPLTLSLPQRASSDATSKAPIKTSARFHTAHIPVLQ